MLDVSGKDAQRKAQENLDALLQERLNSGPSTPMTPQDWEEVRLNSRQLAPHSGAADNPREAEQQNGRNKAVDEGNH